VILSRNCSTEKRASTVVFRLISCDTKQDSRFPPSTNVTYNKIADLRNSTWLLHARPSNNSCRPDQLYHEDRYFCFSYRLHCCFLSGTDMWCSKGEKDSFGYEEIIFFSFKERCDGTSSMETVSKYDSKATFLIL